MAHIPEDRYLWGASKEASIKENAMMGHHRKKAYQRFGILNHKSIERLVSGWVQSFSVKAGSPEEKARNLSGGNLQKVIVAREIGQNTKFLIAVEPTRGVDIGAMEFIHQQLIMKRNSGEAVLIVSSELSELSEIITLADRILVMFEGKIIGEVNGKDTSEEENSFLMAGGKSHS